MHTIRLTALGQYMRIDDGTITHTERAQARLDCVLHVISV